MRDHHLPVVGRQNGTVYQAAIRMGAAYSVDTSEHGLRFLNHARRKIGQA